MYEDFTVQQFENALFKGDRSIMNDEALATVNTEYIDTAGLYDIDEYNKVSYITYLNNRINTIKINIKLQKMFVKEFEVCYIPGLEKFKKFGYSIKWTNKEEFFQKLYEVDMSERMYISQVEKKVKELQKLREKRGPKEDIKKSKGTWVKTLNSLGKVGYKIDKSITTVEELAYMIQQRTEEIKATT